MPFGKGQCFGRGIYLGDLGSAPFQGINSKGTGIGKGIKYFSPWCKAKQMLAVVTLVIQSARQEASENLNMASLLADSLTRTSNRPLDREQLNDSIAAVERIAAKSPDDETLISLMKLLRARANNSYDLGVSADNDVEQAIALAHRLRVTA